MTMVLVTQIRRLRPMLPADQGAFPAKLRVTRPPADGTGGIGMMGSVFPSFSNIRNAARLARREIRGGLRGFLHFLACIALGNGRHCRRQFRLARRHQRHRTEGQSILAGDVRFELRNREATQKSGLISTGLATVAVSTGTRSMARLADGSEQTLAEVKAVDGLIPSTARLHQNPTGR